MEQLGPRVNTVFALKINWQWGSYLKLCCYMYYTIRTPLHQKKSICFHFLSLPNRVKPERCIPARIKMSIWGIFSSRLGSHFSFVAYLRFLWQKADLFCEFGCSLLPYIFHNFVRCFLDIEYLLGRFGDNICHYISCGRAVGGPS